MGTHPFIYTGKLNVISDGGDLSILVVKVFQKHRFGDDKVAGGLSHTIGEILGKLKDGSMKAF